VRQLAAALRPASLLAVSRLSTDFRPASWSFGVRQLAAAFPPRACSRSLGFPPNSGQQAGLQQSGGKPPHSKTTRCRSHHQKPTVTITAGGIVDAAHIHEFRDSRNNDPRNGIALSKNAHWTFDQGLWTIADDYRIIVAIGHFAEAGPNKDNLLASYPGRRLHLPEERTLWPDPIHLPWHRKTRSKTA
jgi:hypothetical protein